MKAQVHAHRKPFEFPGRPITILLIEDNPGDVVLTKEALRGGKIINEMLVAKDGAEALRMIRAFDGDRPDLILLDLNLPKVHGFRILRELKEDPELRRIPVVILTSSKAEEDVLRSYDLHANCYITKPVDLAQFTKVIESIQDYWMTIVKLPPK